MCDLIPPHGGLAEPVCRTVPQEAIDDFLAHARRLPTVPVSDANLSKAELCEKIRTHVPGFVYLESPIGEDPDKRDYIVSNARIEGTGWSPAYSLDDGIRELIQAYRIIRNNTYGNV